MLEERWKHVRLLDERRKRKRERERYPAPDVDPYAEAREEGKRQVPLYQAMMTQRDKRMEKVNCAYQAAEERYAARMKELREMNDDDDDVDK